MSSGPRYPSLAGALDAHNIELPSAQVGRLEQYCHLLWEWNEKLNLTRHTDYDRFVRRDLVDSLAFARFLQHGEKILDVGTGGGVPGVVLAMVRPDLDVTLCESVGKRARVVADIVGRLGLPVSVLAERAENVLHDHEFHTLVVRAVAPLPKLLHWFRPHWHRFDRLLVLKGPAWVKERAEARHLGLLGDLALRKLYTYPLPGTKAEGVLLQLCPRERLTEGKTCRLRPLKPTSPATRVPRTPPP